MSSLSFLGSMIISVPELLNFNLPQVARTTKKQSRRHGSECVPAKWMEPLRWAVAGVDRGRT